MSTLDPPIIEAFWLLFIVASLALIALPGQDMILVMSRSIGQGTKAGVLTAAGVSVGLVGHTFLATFGLGVILRTSEWLFLVLKLVGAAYLFYLGVGLLRTKRAGLSINVIRCVLPASFSSTEHSRIYPIPRLPCSILHFCRSSCPRRRSILRSPCSCWALHLPD